MIHNPTYRVISILQTVSNKKDGYTLSELTRETNIPVGTISPIIKTLVEFKMLEVDKNTNKYTIGIQSFYIGSSFSTKNSALELVRQEMGALSGECGETCQIGILREGQIFYLLKYESKESIRIVSEVGGSLPAYATALGKAILSQYPDEKINEIYTNGLEKLTDRTITDMDILKSQLRAIRESGFAYEEGESGPETGCVAVPIYQNQQLVASLSVVYPIFRKSEDKIQLIKESLVKYKSNIEKILLDRNLI